MADAADPRPVGRRHWRTAVRIAIGHDWPVPVLAACLAVDTPRRVPGAVLFWAHAIRTLAAIPGDEVRAARRSHVVLLGFGEGDVVALRSAVIPFRKVTVVRWQASRPAFERLPRSRWAWFTVPVLVGGRRLLIMPADADMLEEWLVD